MESNKSNQGSQTTIQMHLIELGLWEIFEEDSNDLGGGKPLIVKVAEVGARDWEQGKKLYYILLLMAHTQDVKIDILNKRLSAMEDNFEGFLNLIKGLIKGQGDLLKTLKED